MKPKAIINAILFAAATIFPLTSVNAWYDESQSPTVAEDVYSFYLRIKVPQVRNNTESKGYRKMEWQTIRGELIICWHEDGTWSLDFENMKNSNFKVKGVKVSYEGASLDAQVSPRFVYIGDNKKEKFETPCLSFYVEFQPSYAMGIPGEDNSFVVLLAGDGRTKKVRALGCRVASRFSGMLAGTQGCGCMLYLHKSPTRDAAIFGPSSKVEDAVPTFGKWSAHWKKRR